jgi:hypothetical protein
MPPACGSAKDCGTCQGPHSGPRGHRGSRPGAGRNAGLFRQLRWGRFEPPLRQRPGQTFGRVRPARCPTKAWQAPAVQGENVPMAALVQLCEPLRGLQPIGACRVVLPVVSEDTVQPDEGEEGHQVAVNTASQSGTQPPLSAEAQLLPCQHGEEPHMTLERRTSSALHFTSQVGTPPPQPSQAELIQLPEASVPYNGTSQPALASQPVRTSRQLGNVDLDQAYATAVDLDQACGSAALVQPLSCHSVEASVPVRPLGCVTWADLTAHAHACMAEPAPPVASYAAITRKKWLKQLDDDQRRAVLCRDRVSLVVAGPGVRRQHPNPSTSWSPIKATTPVQATLSAVMQQDPVSRVNIHSACCAALVGMGCR